MKKICAGTPDTLTKKNRFRGGNENMFSHVMIGTNNLEQAKEFYDKLLGTLGIPPAVVDRHRIFYRTKTGTFSVSLPINGKPATFANGGTIGFVAASAEQADAWHDMGVANGGTTCEDPPGIRGSGSTRMYIAYLRDRDGNKLCAIYRLPKDAS
jgi:catechol 2,3-dioxygenase-like lactoylglutathione lyase family enzyme